MCITCKAHFPPDSLHFKSLMAHVALATILDNADLAQIPLLVF